MDLTTFGVTIIIVGMGGTLASLWFLTLIIAVLKRFVPYRESEDREEGQ
jgi:Na+-transporting methylmalonyl-CoA/oxaloacetate decarboxylase gamma subunit